MKNGKSIESGEKTACEQALWGTGDWVGPVALVPHRACSQACETIPIWSQGNFCRMLKAVWVILPSGNFEDFRELAIQQIQTRRYVQFYYALQQQTIFAIQLYYLMKGHSCNVKRYLSHISQRKKMKEFKEQLYLQQKGTIMVKEDTSKIWVLTYDSSDFFF